MKDKTNTMLDVAREAKVSVATVSRVFNKSPLVTDKMTKAVLEVADKMNYNPSRVARRLRVSSQDSGIIGAIITDIKNPFFSEVIRGVEDFAFVRKHGIITCNSDENAERENFYIKTLISEHVSGLVIAPTQYNLDFLQSLIKKGYPIVLVDRTCGLTCFDSVMVNNIEGSRTAVRHLIKLGHTRIGFIGGIQGISTTEERYEGYLMAHREAGIPVEKSLVTFGNSRLDGGIEQTKKLLKINQPLKAIFVTNNLMTLGCLQELHERGVQIPNEMAVVGFDDLPWSVALNPPLTSVKQPGYDIGLNAAEMLFKRIQDPTRVVNHLVLNAEMVIRVSCGYKNKDLSELIKNN